MDNQKMPDLGKTIFATQTARLITGAVIIVPNVIIWFILFKYLVHMSWYVNMSPNIRGILTIAIVVVPLLIMSFIGYKLKDILYQKFSK